MNARTLAVALVLAALAAVLIWFFGFRSSPPRGDSDHARDCWSLSYAAAHGGRRHCAT